MELSAIPDTLSSISYSAQSFGFSNLVLNRPGNVLSLVDASLDQASQSTPQFHISAALSPPTRTLTRSRLRKSRHVKRRLLVGNDGEGNELCVFGDGGDHGDGGGGYFGRGGGGGGKWWNFGGVPNWDDFSDNSIYDPAFDVVYEILCWIAMSNCLHFAFKKVLRFAADGFGGREKVPMRLPPVC